MNVSQLMQRDVVTVSPDATLKKAAALLVEHGISGIPVCLPDGRVVGVLSEADILGKEQALAAAESPRLLGWILEHAYGDGARSTAITVAEAMSSPAITISPKAPAASAAALMTRKRINRLPVTDGMSLVGIITRADLVRAFARTDAEIEQEIRDDVLLDALWISPNALAIKVEDGVVTLRGRVDSKSVARIVTAYVRRVPGIVALRSELDWGSGDLSHRRNPSRVWAP